jgi:hypothetical protein
MRDENENAAECRIVQEHTWTKGSKEQCRCENAMLDSTLHIGDFVHALDPEW